MNTTTNEILFDAALDDLRAAGLDIRRPIVCGAFAGALAGRLSNKGNRGRPMAELIEEAVTITIVTLKGETEPEPEAGQ